MLETGRGVCQDYAHLMIALARGWGVPSRYVSGYLYIADHAGSPIRQAAMHAWVECLLPDGSWAGFDPANDRPVGSGYIRVAVGRDYGRRGPDRRRVPGRLGIRADGRDRRGSGAGLNRRRRPKLGVRQPGR